MIAPSTQMKQALCRYGVRTPIEIIPTGMPASGFVPGDRARHCERRVAAAGLAESVCFVGYLDRATALLDCYRAADVFVFASPTETQGLVLLEAMAQGAPVVSTAVMGTIDVLAGGGARSACSPTGRSSGAWCASVPSSA